jgi:nitrite reductase/ring-hydroxylating ferredoxin subunit/uncharacterized membrane protein
MDLRSDQHAPPGVSPNGPRVVTTARWVETAVDAVQRTSWPGTLVSRLIDVFSNVVGPGTVKDALSGTWLGHPAHPVLTDVTVGAWTCAVALDLFGSEDTESAADALVGLGTLSALPTAVTGLSDLADTEGKNERNLGGVHALSNVSATTLFGLSYLARRRGRRGTAVAFSVAGITVANVGAFIGGHLSYRRGIGVDRSAFDDRIGKWTATIRDEELLEARPQKVRVGRNDVLLYRADGRIHALANRCTHRGGPLHEGDISEGAVTCPWHLSSFRLEDGAIVRGPASAPAPRYEARVVDGMVEVRSA